MSFFIATWNLNKEGPSYDKARSTFFQQLQKFEHSYSSKLETTAFLSTTWDVQQVYEFLRKAIDDNDRLFVSRLHAGFHKGWLDKTQWEWINARV